MDTITTEITYFNSIFSYWIPVLVLTGIREEVSFLESCHLQGLFSFPNRNSYLVFRKQTNNNQIFWSVLGPLCNIRITELCFRLLAARGGMVQRLRYVRRACMFLQHNAHVLHQSRTLPGNTQSSQDETHLLHETTGRHKNSSGLGAVDARV